MATLDRLRAATRLHQCVANADRLALTTPANRSTYIAYLAKLYGFEAPIESALSLVPEVVPLVEGQHAISAAIVSELCTHKFPAATLLELPIFTREAFATTTEALGWCYVAMRNRDGHELLRTYLGQRDPSLVQATLSLRIPAELWSVMEDVFERAGDSDAIIAAALDAFDAQHEWLRPHAISGTAMHASMSRAHAALRVPLLVPRFARTVPRRDHDAPSSLGHVTAR